MLDLAGILQPVALCLCRLVDAADDEGLHALAAAEGKKAARSGVCALQEAGLLRPAEPGCELLLELLEGVRSRRASRG